MRRTTIPICMAASVTWYCSCIKCACIAPVPSSGGVCDNCASGNHH